MKPVSTTIWNKNIWIDHLNIFELGIARLSKFCSMIFPQDVTVNNWSNDSCLINMWSLQLWLVCNHRRVATFNLLLCINFKIFLRLFQSHYWCKTNSHLFILHHITFVIIPGKRFCSIQIKLKFNVIVLYCCCPFPSDCWKR